MFEELSRGLAIRLAREVGDCKLAGPVNAHKEVVLERGSFCPVFKSSTVARLRRFATVLGLMPNSLLNCASESCYRCIAALTARVIVALP